MGEAGSARFGSFGLHRNVDSIQRAPAFKNRSNATAAVAAIPAQL